MKITFNINIKLTWMIGKKWNMPTVFEVVHLFAEKAEHFRLPYTMPVVCFIAPPKFI